MADDTAIIKADYGPIVKIKTDELPFLREAREVLHNGQPTGTYVYNFLKTPVTGKITELQQV